MSGSENSPERPFWLRPLAEQAELNRDVVWPDLSPLTDEELKALRRRLNLPTNTGGMSNRERRDRHRLGAIIRPLADVEQLLGRVEATHRDIKYSPSSQLFGAGVIAGLRWALGREMLSPVKRIRPETIPPSYGDVYSEQAQASRITQGEEPNTIGQAIDYVAGIEHALMWLLGRTARTPW